MLRGSTCILFSFLPTSNVGLKNTQKFTWFSYGLLQWRENTFWLSWWREITFEPKFQNKSKRQLLKCFENNWNTWKYVLYDTHQNSRRGLIIMQVILFMEWCTWAWHSRTCNAVSWPYCFSSTDTCVFLVLLRIHAGAHFVDNVLYAIRSSPYDIYSTLICVIDVCWFLAMM